MSKTSKRLVGIGFLEDFELKKLEIKQRLAKIFIVFIKTPDGGYFLTGGKEPPSLYGNGNFRCVFMGHSLSDLAHGEDLLREISSLISTTFSELDLHSTVVLDFLSKYLKSDLEDMRVPVGSAVEFMIIDSNDDLMRVTFSGEMEIDDLEKSDKDIFVLGAHDSRFQKRLLVDLAKAPRVLDPEAMEKFAVSLKKKYKLPHIGFIL